MKTWDFVNRARVLRARKHIEGSLRAYRDTGLDLTDTVQECDRRIGALESP